jgi:hypothetical protein
MRSSWDAPKALQWQPPEADKRAFGAAVLFQRNIVVGALKSSGTSPNFLITLASLKSPVAGSPARLHRQRTSGTSLTSRDLVTSALPRATDIRLRVLCRYCGRTVENRADKTPDAALSRFAPKVLHRCGYATSYTGAIIAKLRLTAEVAASYAVNQARSEAKSGWLYDDRPIVFLPIANRTSQYRCRLLSTRFGRGRPQ